MATAREAYERLVEGNRRFIAGAAGRIPHSYSGMDPELLVGQAPVAVVVGCSDSRVPPEIVFDQGLGDLFVVRVAGNIITPFQIGSVEFAVQTFGTRLVVVLGHSGCGALEAVLDDIENPTADGTSNLHSIIDWIRPAVEELAVSYRGADRVELLRRAVRANVRASAEHLRLGSPVLRRYADQSGLCIVEAEYAIETGRVEFLGGMPPVS